MYPKWPPEGEKLFATEAFAKNLKFPPGSEVCLKGKNDVKITGGFYGVCWQVDFLFIESDVFLGDQRFCAPNSSKTWQNIKVDSLALLLNTVGLW